MKLKDAIKIAKAELTELETAAKETIWLFAAKSKQSTAYLLAHDETQIEDAVFENFLERRKQKVPFEYITNEADFFGYNFYVDERCLIPRPETELLVEYALKIAKRLDAHTLLDICTGSGVVACTIKKELPHINVSASDISKNALDVAKINAKKLDVDIDIIQSNLFSKIKDDKFDILTANPPYIQNGYILDKGVLYEPHNALFGGKNGTEIVIAALNGFFARNFKAFVCEIGYDQKNALESILCSINNIEYGFYEDYAGFDRGFWVIKESMC